MLAVKHVRSTACDPKKMLEDDELQQKQVEVLYGSIYMGKYAHLHNLRLLLEIRVKMVIALITTFCWRYVSDRDANHVKAAALSFGEKKRENPLQEGEEIRPLAKRPILT